MLEVPPLSDYTLRERVEAEEMPVEPEDVLELIRSAPERYETVRAALRYRGNSLIHKEIRQRIVRSEAGRRAFGISAREASEPIQHPEPDGPFGWRCRAWHADQYHWRTETEVPGGGLAIAASTGRRRLPIGGPPGSGLVWDRRVGVGPRENDPRWFRLALDNYWTFYPLLTDEICGISHELRPLDLTVEGSVSWVGREAVRRCNGTVLPVGDHRKVEVTTRNLWMVRHHPEDVQVLTEPLFDVLRRLAYLRGRRGIFFVPYRYPSQNLLLSKAAFEKASRR